MSLYETLMDAIGENDDQQSVSMHLDSGIPELNHAMSGSYTGGFGVGRLYEIFGPASCGKCQPASTMILGERGLISFEEMFATGGFKTTCKSADEPYSFGLLNENSEIENTSHLTWNNRRPIKKITGNYGFTTEATHNHPLRVLNSLGSIVWKKAGDIEVGDYLVMMRGTEQFGNSELDAEEARFIGYLVADGTLSRTEKFGLTNSDPDISRIYCDFVENRLGLKTSKNESDGRAPTYWTFGLENRQMIIDKYGLEVEKAAGKTVPLCVRSATREAQIAFIRSYMECETHIHRKSSTIETISASQKLLSDLQLMLLNLGMVSRLSEKVVNDVSYYRLTLCNADAVKYIEIVGFETKDRLEKLLEFKASDRSPAYDIIPNISGLIRSTYEACDTDRSSDRICGDFMGRREISYKNLGKVIDHLSERSNRFSSSSLQVLKSIQQDNFYYERVTEITDDEVPTFDVVMPKTHSFWANGFISHNTFLATMLMVQAQKMGGIAGFSDHERSFEAGLAQKLGLDTSKSGYWVYKRPETVEESFDTAIEAMMLIREKKLIPDDAPIVWTFDSIASMIPRSVLYDKDGKRRSLETLNMRDNLSLAHILSAALKQLSIFANDYNAMCLLLNQIRLDPGVMFGNPEVTPGGRATAFYCTGRVSLGKKHLKEDKKDSKRLTGAVVSARTLKNKLVHEGESATWRIIFESGGATVVDKIGTLLDFCIRKGFISKAGAYLEWEGKKIYASALRQQLAEQEDGYEQLLKLLPECEDPKLGDLPTGP